MPNESQNVLIEDLERQESPFELFVPEGMLAVYSDIALVMHTPNEFIISFFQNEYPVRKSLPKGHEKSDEKTSEKAVVKGRCVSRIIVSPGQMENLLEAMKFNYEKYSAKLSKDDKDKA